MLPFPYSPFIRSVKILSLLLFLTTLLFAQTPVSSLTDNDRSSNPSDLLIEQLTAWPQEKIYIQTDKPTYLAGERLWLRTHLVDAASHQPIYLSRYVYAELFSPMDVLEKRIMMRPDSTGAYSGYINLDDDLTEGTYTLRAYTNYMRNNGDEAFVKKSVEILNPLSLQFEPRITFEVNNNRVQTDIHFFDRQNDAVVTPEVVTINLAYRQATTVKPDRDGHFRWRFQVPASTPNRTMLLSAWWNGHIYKRYYTIPHDPTQFQVNFFPEGGYLIPGAVNQVGFKAVATDGLGRPVSGTLYNADDEEVARFETWKNGMGFFNFMVQPNQTYYALCETSEGHSSRFDLPQPHPEAITLSVRTQGNRIIAGLLGASNYTEPLTLLLHQRGNPLFQEKVDPGTSTIAFPAVNYPFGILSLLLLDDNNNILSERLLFNTTENRLPPITLTGDTVMYRRSKAELTFQLQSDMADNLGGNFALSITDQNSVTQDSTTHIVSHLLLSSELKGHIESPADYFNGDKIDKYALDALLITQGWRRYNLPQLLKGDIKHPDKYAAEKSQTLTGSAGNFALLKDGEVSLVATLDTMVSTTTTRTDQKGNFRLQFEYPEGTTLIVQSLTRRGSRYNAININPVEYPEPRGASLPLSARYHVQHTPTHDPYIRHAEEAYMHEFGMRHILLDELTVEARRIEHERYKKSTFYTPLAATGVRTSEDIELLGVATLKSLLYTQPGIIVRSDKVTTTRSERPVLFVIDDRYYPDFFNNLDDIEVNSVESIFVVRDNNSIPGYFPGTDGALVIYTKLGYEGPKRKRPNIDTVIPLGYQQPDEFYMPRYETEEDRKAALVDLRTTIFWQPNLRFSEQGRAVTSFYSADLPTTYNLLIEGVTDSGIPLRSHHTITVQPTPD